MSYVQKTLLPEEKILYYTKPHFIIFYPVFIWLAMATGFLYCVNIPIIFGYVLLLVSMISCINSLINYYCSEYAITNKRVIMKVGFIHRKSIEIFLDRIESVRVEQSIIGRIVGYGSVSIDGTGGTQDPFLYIPKPLEFRNSVQQQIERKSN